MGSTVTFNVVMAQGYFLLHTGFPLQNNKATTSSPELYQILRTVSYRFIFSYRGKYSDLEQPVCGGKVEKHNGERGMMHDYLYDCIQIHEYNYIDGTMDISQRSQRIFPP